MKQPNPINVDKAINQGKLHLVTIPKALIFISFGFSNLYFCFEYWNAGTAPSTPTGKSLAYVGIFAAGLLVAFLWRSLHTVAWKIWALERVNNAPRLYEVARSKDMIHPPGSWLHLFDFKTPAQQRRLSELEARLDAHKSAEAAKNWEITFEFATARLVLKQFLHFVFFLLITAELFAFGFTSLLLCQLGLLLFYLYREYKNRGAALLRINANGVLFDDLPLIPWGDIQHVSWERMEVDHSIKDVLVIHSHTQHKKYELDITELEYDGQKIRSMVSEYLEQWRIKHAKSEKN